MFLDAMLAGLRLLTYWETYVAGLEYLAIVILPMTIMGMIMEKSEDVGGAVGCLGMILLPVLQVTGLLVFVLTLAPIMFGLADDAAWSVPWSILAIAPGAFFKLVGVLFGVSFLSAFIPFLGQLNSLQVLLQGGITLTFVLGIMASSDSGIVEGPVDFIPGFWFSVGLLVIGGVMSWIGQMVVALIAGALRMAGQGIGHLLFPVGAILGFIPLFMYGAWLGAQVKGGF